MVKLVGAGKNPRSFGIDIYSDVTQIPDSVGVVSVLFQLQYADSKDIKAVLDLYVPTSPYTSAVPLPGAIIVTESTIELRNIAKIIAAADVPPAEVVSRFYPLQRANAKDVVDKLTKLFERAARQAPEGPVHGADRTADRAAQWTARASRERGDTATVSGLSEDTIIVGRSRWTMTNGPTASTW